MNPSSILRFLATCAVLASSTVQAQTLQLLLNDVVGSTTQTDVEYVQIFSNRANASLTGVSLVVARSSGTSIGQILQRLDFPANTRVGCNGKFLIGNTDLILQSYDIAVDYPIPQDYIINSPYTIALMNTSAVPASGPLLGTEPKWDAVFVTNGDDPTGAIGNFWKVKQIGPDGTFLPAGFRRNPNGGTNFTLNDFFITGNRPRPKRIACNPTVAPTPQEPLPYAIHEIQGSGNRSPLLGEKVVARGIVTLDAQNSDADQTMNLGGFFMQTVPGLEDSNPLTSQGIFVDDSNMRTFFDVNLGDDVSVTGFVRESTFFMTQIFNVISIQRTQTGRPLPNYTVVDLKTFGKFSYNADNQTQPDLEQYEGMRISLTGNMIIVDQFLVDRFNQVEVYAGAARPETYTQINSPGSGYDAYQVNQGKLRIAYDDGLAREQAGPSFIEGFSPYTTTNAPRMGDTFSTLNGVLHQDYAGNFATGGNARWRLRGDRDSSPVVVAKTARPAQPVTFSDNRDKRYKRKACSVLLQSYFITLNAGGANDAPELKRQQDKIITALVQMDCDILALEEFENVFASGASSTAPLTVLATALNADSRVTDKTYTAVYPGVTALPGEFSTAVGFIIKTSRVKVLGTPKFIDFNDGNNNPTLVVTFQWGSGLLGLRKSCANFAVNSFKSKGGRCTNDPLFPDGAGACDLERRNAADILVSQMAIDLTGGGCAGKNILMGKFNAAAAEEPITIIKNAGYTTAVTAGPHYDFVFDFKTQSLGYVFTKGITAVAGAVWHINADEATVLDYNTNFGRNQTIFDATSPARFSDFDPIIIKI